MYRPSFLPGAFTLWLFLGHGLLPVIKGQSLLSNFQEFAMLNTADTDTTGSTDEFPQDAFPPDNAFPANNDFPPTDVTLTGQLPFPSVPNVSNADPSGLNQGLPFGNTLPSNVIDNTIGSSVPITTGSNGGSMFPSGTNDPFAIPIGAPSGWSIGTPIGTVNTPKPTVDSKVNFFLPWIPKGSLFVNSKDGSTHLFQPTDNWIHGEPVGGANFGENLPPAIPIAPIVSIPSFPISGSVPVSAMPLSPKPITPIQLPKPIGTVDQLPLATGTNFNPGKPVSNTGVNIKPIQLPKPIGYGVNNPLPPTTGSDFKAGKPVGTVDSIKVKPINLGGLSSGTVGIPTFSKPIVDTISGVGTIILSGPELNHVINDILMPNGNNAADQWVGDIYDGRPRPVVVEVTEVPISVSPACEILGQMSLNTMGRDKKEYARLRQQCAQERKEARQALKEQKQLLKAAKQEEKQIRQAIRQEQKAIKQEERQNIIAAKQEQKAIVQEQRAAKKEEKAALKAFNQEQKGAVPMGAVDFDVEAPLSPACEALARMALNTSVQDQQEFARLTRQCAEESKQTPKEQKRAQTQNIKAVKQEKKAVKKEQRAVKQLEKAVKQADRADQRAEKAALKVLNLEQKAAGARPLGSIDLSGVSNNTPSPNIENIPGFGDIDWNSQNLENIPGLGIIDWSG